MYEGVGGSLAVQNRGTTLSPSELASLSFYPFELASMVVLLALYKEKSVGWPGPEGGWFVESRLSIEVDSGTPVNSAFLCLVAGCCERWGPLLQQKVWKEWTGRGNEWMRGGGEKGGGRWRLDEGGRDGKGLEGKVF